MRADVSVFSDATILLHGAKRSDRGVILNRDMTRQRPSIYKYGVIANQAIVTDVRVRHDEVVATDSRDASAFHGSPVYRGEFAKLVGISHLQGYALALVR